MSKSPACRFALAAIMLVLGVISPVLGQETATEKLDRSVDIDKPIDATLNDVREFLSDLFDLKILFDTEAFAREKRELPKDARIKLPKLANAMLDTTLRLTLSQADAVYEVRGNGMVIMPNKKDGEPRPFPPISDARKEAIKKQREEFDKKTVDIEKPIDASLKDIVEFLSDRYDLPLIIDERTFRREKIENIADARIKVPSMKGPLDQALRKVLAGQKATYEFHGDHIRIVPRDGRES